MFPAALLVDLFVIYIEFEPEDSGILGTRGYSHGKFFPDSGDLSRLLIKTTFPDDEFFEELCRQLRGKNATVTMQIRHNYLHLFLLLIPPKVCIGGALFVDIPVKIIEDCIYTFNEWKIETIKFQCDMPLFLICGAHYYPYNPTPRRIEF